MKANCKNCGKEINYNPSQKTGTWCSNKCQGDYKIKQRLVENSKWSNTIRAYIIRERGEKCEVCGITDWNGKSITLQIDHINGNRCDNRLENLKVMCPNCHSQTDTFAGKNVSDDGKKRRNAALVQFRIKNTE